ncbi:GD15653 [Drosophila simulans]|uniref:GD15653 n=1 Tax=Drosophila simulans TaxID=7240 RepID=B4R6W9_DROSI|nr:GD15653 [Drosophila simulans]
MSLGGESKHTPKLSNLRPLDDDQLVRIVRTPRPSNGLGQHPAQDRLKRLQAQLKRMQDNGKEQGTTKRSAHSSLTARRSTEVCCKCNQGKQKEQKQRHLKCRMRKSLPQPLPRLCRA